MAENKTVESETIKVVTVNHFNRTGANANKSRYYRLSLYEFKGEPLKAFFVEDLCEGFWDLKSAIYRGKEKAKEMKIQFLYNVTMGDPIDKLFEKILS